MIKLEWAVIKPKLCSVKNDQRWLRRVPRLVEIIMWLLYLCKTSEMHFHAIVRAQNFSMFPMETLGRAQPKSLLGSVKK